MKGTLDEWLAWLDAAHPKKMDLGLERVGEVWHRMGKPGDQIPTVVVAGTNGKGSSVAMLGALARSSGQSWGAFTSPHLLRFNERIAVSGEPADDATLLASFHRIEAARRKISLSYFEFACLAGLDTFAAAEVDFMFLEVGLGGRLDAVNVVDADVALITSIDIDHAHVLGDTREKIFIEKAGIARARRPVVVADPSPPANAACVLAEKNSMTHWRGLDFNASLTRQQWDYESGNLKLCGLPLPALPGAHQVDNAAGAFSAWVLAGEELNHALAVHALETVHHPGRLETVSQSPLIRVDVGHNPAAARAIAHWLTQQPPVSRVGVIGMLADKNVEAFLGPLYPLLDELVVVPTTGHRGQDGASIEAFANSVGLPAARFDSVDHAMAHACRAVARNGEILCCGSFQVAESVVRWSRDHGHALSGGVH